MVGNVPSRFRIPRGDSEIGLRHAWNGHRNEWRNLGITSQTQLQRHINRAINNGRMGIQNHPVKGRQYMFHKEIVFPNGIRRGLFVPANKDGTVVTAYIPRKTGYFESRNWFLEIR